MKAPGIDEDEEGPFVWGSVAVHSAAPGDIGSTRFRTCPIAWCHPDIHPYVDTALRAYSRFRSFGYSAIAEAGERVTQAVEVVISEMDELRRVQEARG